MQHTSGFVLCSEADPSKAQEDDGTLLPARLFTRVNIYSRRSSAGSVNGHRVTYCVDWRNDLLVEAQIFNQRL